MNKAELRARMRKYRPNNDEHWIKGLLNWDVLKKAETVFCFLPLRDEPDTMPLIQQMLMLNKRVCIPKCIDEYGKMEAVLFNSEVCFTDAMGIQTTSGEAVASHDIDLVLVPGLAFDSKGNRLGRGKGYYDRFLADNSFITCGICPAMRFVSSVPTELDDFAVDFVFTPYGLYKTKDE